MIDFKKSGLAAALEPFAGRPPVQRSNVISFDPALFPKRPIPPGGLESLSLGIKREEMAPLDFGPVVQGCAFIRDALVTGGKDYDQPLWNLTTLVATFLEEGHALAHKMA